MSAFSTLGHKSVMVENICVNSDDLETKLKAGWWLEPSIGGYRMLTIISGSCIEYLNKQLHPITHIVKKYFDPVFSSVKDAVVIDGELFGPEWCHAPNTKRRDGIDCLVKRSCYYIFDVLPLSDFMTKPCVDITLQQRYRLLWRTCRKLSYTTKVHIVNHNVVNSLDTAEKYAARWMQYDYQGGVLKDPKSPYIFDSSDYWIYVKPSTLGTFLCTNVLQPSKQFKGICIDRKAVPTEVTAGFSKHQRLQFHTRPDLILNKQVEIKYQAVDANEKLVLPRFVSVRYDL